MSRHTKEWTKISYDRHGKRWYAERKERLARLKIEDPVAWEAYQERIREMKRKSKAKRKLDPVKHQKDLERHYIKTKNSQEHVNLLRRQRYNLLKHTEGFRDAYNESARNSLKKRLKDPEYKERYLARRNECIRRRKYQKAKEIVAESLHVLSSLIKETP